MLRAARTVFLLGFGIFVLVTGVTSSSPPILVFGCAVTAGGVLSLIVRISELVTTNRRELRTGLLTELAVTYSPHLLGTSVDRSEGERRATLGTGRATFDAASARVLRWEVKTRAGFRVTRVGPQGAFFSDDPVVTGEAAVIRWGLLRETAQVVRVVREPRRRGFAYGTLPRHPLIGEEAFLVEWSADDTVELVIRSFSSPNGVGWAMLWPVMQIARQVFIRRYLRALLD